MREEWNLRAKDNAQYYVANATENWDQREFFRSGEINVANEVMPDMQKICGGTHSPRDLSMVEIGCGVGRMTRALAGLFGTVNSVDVSEEMIAQARRNTEDLPNVHLFAGDGATLTGMADSSQDFAFSFIVFQHIPSKEVIASYCRDAYRVLRPGAFFKFQVQGGFWERDAPPDTWHGVSFSPYETTKLAADSGFEFESSSGAGTQYYWLWFRKPL